MWKNSGVYGEVFNVHIVGVDGTGKSTLCGNLERIFQERERGVRAMFTREPSIPAVKSLYRGEINNHAHTDLTRLLASTLDRQAVHVYDAQRMLAGEQIPQMLIRDRSGICAAAYHATNPSQALEILQAQFALFPMPDLVVWLRAVLSTSAAREIGATHTIARLAMIDACYIACTNFLVSMGVEILVFWTNGSRTASNLALDVSRNVIKVQRTWKNATG